MSNPTTSLPASSPRFANVTCSQCAQDFGPGNAGFSHCRNHRSEAENREHDAFEAADNTAFQAARSVLAQIDGITDVAFNERALVLILDKLRKRIEASAWKHAEHAKDSAEKLTDAVFYLENAADDQVRASL